MHCYFEFINSKYFSDNTILCGSDVLLLKKFNIPEAHDLAITYRYHRTMPYCSDWIYISKNNGAFVSNLISNVYLTMKWMPSEIQASWADQLSLAIEIGFLHEDQFDGSHQISPKSSKILLLPSSEFLFTPNDFFSSTKSSINGQLKDTPCLNSLFEHATVKTAMHFKGNRKNLLICLAYLFKKK